MLYDEMECQSLTSYNLTNDSLVTQKDNLVVT